MKRIRIVLAAAVLAIVMPSAYADAPIFVANSVEDRTQPEGMNYRYALIGVSVRVMQSNPGELVFKATFGTSLNARSFLNYNSSRPLLRLKVLNTLGSVKDDNGYLWLEAPNDRPYQGSTPIDAVGSIFRDQKLGPSGGRVSLDKCKPKTWMDAGETSDWVAFSIDRNCADINDMFWVSAFMDADIYGSSLIVHSKYSPKEPMYVDLRGIPRPPKMKDQYVAYNSAIPQQKMESSQTSVQINSTSGLPVLVATSTSSVCTPSITGMIMQIQFNSAGMCKVEAYSLGNTVYNPSERSYMSFYISPYVMQNQEIYWDEPYDVIVGDEDFDLYIYSSSKLPVTVTSQSPSVCQFNDPGNPSMVSIVGAGYCQLTVSQAGNERFYSRTATASFYVEKAPVVEPSATPPTRPKRTKSNTAAAPKVFSATKTTETQQDINTKKNTGSVSTKAQTKKTITCTRLGLIKKVTAVNPTCPSGWKKK